MGDRRILLLIRGGFELMLGGWLTVKAKEKIEMERVSLRELGRGGCGD